MAARHRCDVRARARADTWQGEAGERGCAGEATARTQREKGARRLPGVRARWRQTLPGPERLKSLWPQGPGQRLTTQEALAHRSCEKRVWDLPQVFSGYLTLHSFYLRKDLHDGGQAP